MSSNIYALLGGNDGSLWIGTYNNLSHLKQGNLTNYLDAPGSISSIIEDRLGTVWITRMHSQDETGPLCQVRDTKLQCHGKADGISFQHAESLAQDEDGNFWIGTDTVVTRWKAGSSIEYMPPGLRAKGGIGVHSLAAGRDGSMWIGMVVSGRGLGLQHVVRGIWRPFIAPGFDSSTLRVTALFLDRENALWIGTENQGIYRIYERTVDRFSAADGLSSDTVENFYEDREGNLWIATSEGIDCFRNLRMTSFSTREGLTANWIDSVLASRDGTVWLGNQGALDLVRSGKVSSIRAKDGLPGDNVTSLLEDHDGRLWVGVDDKLAVYEDGKFHLVRGPKGASIGTIIAMAEDVDHNIWVEAVGGKLVRIQDREVRQKIADSQVPPAYSLAADPQGGIWLGLDKGGLARYRSGQLNVFSPKFGPEIKVRQVIVSADGSVLGAAANGMIGLRNQTLQVLTTRNGLPCDRLHAIVADKDGAIWLYAECGLIKIENPELQKWWNHQDATIRVTLFDAFDGVRPGLVPFHPGASRSPDGRLWFANNTVVQMIDPTHLAGNRIPPPVHVEEVIADHERFPQGNDLSLPPLTRDLEIDYTALSFAVPQKVHFRYMLEGHDAAWQEPGTRRQAFYNDLRPGHYRFRVAACNNDGVWNDQGDVLSLSIAPAWYQTLLFRFLCVAAFLLLLWSFYQLRLKRLRAHFNMTLEARVSERTRIARELHDTLLQSLSALLLRFQTVSKMLPARPDEAKQRVDSAIEQASDVITEGRNAVQELRSGGVGGVADNDLAQAIGTLGRELLSGPMSENPPKFHVQVEGTPKNLNLMVRDEAYRIAGEALRNAVRHAGAKQIEVEIQYGEQQLRLRIRDNGKGIDPGVLDQGHAPGHWGLRGMRERAKLLGGNLEVWSEVGSGSEVELTLPAANAYAEPASRWSTIWRWRQN